MYLTVYTVVCSRCCDPGNVLTWQLAHSPHSHTHLVIMNVSRYESIRFQFGIETACNEYNYM